MCNKAYNLIKKIENDFAKSLRVFSKEIINLYDNRLCDSKDSGSLEIEGFVVSYSEDKLNPKISIREIDIDNLYKHEILALQSLSGVRIKDLKDYINN